ncbi:MAG: hypothetical protein Q8R63_04975 [Ramlibacter sp.]|nr:hypothetical protein [Ramlibacter sp.]
MTTFAALLAYLVVLSIMIAFICAVRAARLKNRFKRLAPLTGRSLDEILKAVGKPGHRSRTAPNREILEWKRVGFHIALAFTNNVCDGIIQVEGSTD